MPDNIWEKIIDCLKKNPTDLQTAPLKGKGTWFRAETISDNISVSNAKNEHPEQKVSRLKSPRLLTKDEFIKVYPFYIRRINGEQVSKEVTQITRNQVYIFSILKNCGGI